MRRTLPMLVLAVACGGPDEPKKRDRVTSADECDPTIHVPGPLTSSVTALADPHENTFGAAPEPFQVHLGWPSSDPSTSIGFVWRTAPDTLATVVEYGKGGKLDQRVEGASFLYGGLDTGQGDQRVHEVKLCGALEPNTTYTYRVGGDGHWSPEFSFTTPGEPGSFDTFRIAILGDSRGAYETWAEQILAAEAHSPDFYVFGGDMVNLGPSQPEWDAWFEAAGDVFAEKVVVPAHGNHEFLSVHYFAQFSLPNNEEWFSVRYGDLHLVSLNDTVRATEDRTVHQVDYMREVFAGHESAWQVAVHHQSIYSQCTVHHSDEDLRVAWGPVYDEIGMDMVFAGHNHVYERSIPIFGDGPADPALGTTYFVTGGAGAPLYGSFDEEWWGDVAISVEHYLIADFGPDGVTVTARDRSENVLDTFTMARR